MIHAYIDAISSSNFVRCRNFALILIYVNIHPSCNVFGQYWFFLICFALFFFLFATSSEKILFFVFKFISSLKRAQKRHNNGWSQTKLAVIVKCNSCTHKNTLKRMVMSVQKARAKLDGTKLADPKDASNANSFYYIHTLQTSILFSFCGSLRSVCILSAVCGQNAHIHTHIVSSIFRTGSYFSAIVVRLSHSIVCKHFHLANVQIKPVIGFLNLTKQTTS